MECTLNTKVEKDKDFIEARGFKKLYEIVEKIILKTTLEFFAGENISAKFWFYVGESREPFCKLAIYSAGKSPDMSKIRTLPEYYINRISCDGNTATLYCGDDCVMFAVDLKTNTRTEDYKQRFYVKLERNLEIALMNTDYFI